MKHTPTPAEKESVLDAVLMPLERAFLTPTKQRLEALRDKWNNRIASMRVTIKSHPGTEHAMARLTTESSIADVSICLDDLQKEIDLLP